MRREDIVSRAWIIGSAVAVGILAAYLLWWPVPISPARWTPPDAPELTGAYAPNDTLAATERLSAGAAPESVAVDADGRVVCGLEDGSIVRVARGAAPETLVEVDGRPLGMAYAADGDLIVCDMSGRLLAVGEDGSVRVLVAEVDGRSLRLVNDVAIAPDAVSYTHLTLPTN